MKLNLILEGDHTASRLHTLHVMREMALSGKYAPMNVDLFYDQFFDATQLKGKAKQQLDAVKESWLSVFDHFTCFMDYGLDMETDKALQQLQAKHPAGFFEYELLASNQGHLRTSEHDNLREAYFHRCGDDPSFADMLAFVTSSDLAETPLPDHLPKHFLTHARSASFNVADVQATPNRVIFESPFAGDMATNVEYAAQSIAKLIMEDGVAPMASHLLYTRMLDDTDPQERNIGIDAGLAYGQHAQGTIIALDRGMSTGMVYGIKNAEKAQRPLSFLSLSTDPDVQKSVSKLTGLEDAQAWVEQQKSKNPTLFEQSGFVTPVPSVQNNTSPLQSTPPKP